MFFWKKITTLPFSALLLIHLGLFLLYCGALYTLKLIAFILADRA
jgi:hypothetical protein